MTREILSRPWSDPHESGWSRDIPDVEDRESRTDPTLLSGSSSLDRNLCFPRQFPPHERQGGTRYGPGEIGLSHGAIPSVHPRPGPQQRPSNRGRHVTRINSGIDSVVARKEAKSEPNSSEFSQARSLLQERGQAICISCLQSSQLKPKGVSSRISLRA